MLSLRGLTGREGGTREMNNQSYGIIYTDPPWPQKKGNIRKCRPNQTRALDYATMSIDDIFSLHDKFFAQTEKKHNVFMWAIDKYLHEAELKMQERGYILHARMIWDKQNGIAPAFTVRYSHEYLLWFYPKGNMLKPCEEQQGKFLTVFQERSTAHSKKPEYAYRMIEAMFPDAKKIELFARNTRAGWDAWGDQLPTEEERTNG
jgi:N6-adenosine-specific RNA methylase IME4